MAKIEDVLEIKPNRKDYLGEAANTLGSIPHASDGCRFFIDMIYQF